VNRLEPDWPTFLADFERHWPTDCERTWVRDVLSASTGVAALVNDAVLRRGGLEKFTQAIQRRLL